VLHLCLMMPILTYSTCTFGKEKDIRDSFLSPFKVQVTGLQDSLLSYAPCPILVLCWAYFVDDNRVCWQFHTSSYFAHLSLLLLHYNCSIYFLLLLYLIISMIRGNVEIPSRNFPRPSLLRQKNNPCWVQLFFMQVI